MEIFEDHKFICFVDFTAALKINFSNFIIVYQCNESPIDTKTLFHEIYSISFSLNNALLYGIPFVYTLTGVQTECLNL